MRRTLSGRNPRRRGRIAGVRNHIRAAFLYVYVACSLGANAALLIPRGPTGEPGDNSLFALSWLLLHGGGVCLLLTSRHRRPRALLLAAVFGALILSSAIWSVSPADTAVYGGMAAGNIVLAYVAAAELSLRRLLHMVLAVLLVMVALGMLAHLVGLPQVADFDVHERTNSFGGTRTRGFFQHNIMAGFYGALGAALALSLLGGVRRVGAVALFLVFVLMTGSATGMALMATVVVVQPLLRLVVTWLPLGAFAAVSVPLLICASVLLWVLWVPLATALGRDPTMTGRTVLWGWGAEAVAERPVLGWGFAGYFHSPHGAVPSLYVPEFVGYEIAHFHNSFLQTAVDLGLVGLALLVALLASTWAGAYRHARTIDRRTGTAALLLLTLMLVAAPTEVLFFTYNQFGMLALFLLFFSMSAGPRLRAERLSRRAAGAWR